MSYPNNNIENEDLKKAEELEQAYISLKKLIFYENNILLHLKQQIAEFEDVNNFLIEEKRKSFFKNLSKNMLIDSEIDNLIKKVSFKKVIKKLDEQIKRKNFSDYINNENSEYVSISEIKNILLQEEKRKEIKYNYIIDCPIELHIISVLWVMKEGYKIDNELSKYSYGYRLNFNNNGNLKNDRIFKWYVNQYKEWRDTGIKKAKEIITDEENAVIMNLDLKKFYYNINYGKLKEKLKKENPEVYNSSLTEIIFKINEKYGLEVKEDNKERDGYGNESIIPIGLYSSPILANLYLKELDEIILKKGHPYYYGRYVDDLFLVFKEYNEIENKKNYLKEKLGFLFNEEVKGKEAIINQIGIENSFNIEHLSGNDKQNIIFLDDNKKRIEIQNIENDFTKRASTFAFLPNEEEIAKIYKEISIDNENDIRNKKYDVSTYLAKLLNIFCEVDKKKSEKKIKEYATLLLEFFDDENFVKYCVYYEKVFTFLVMCNLGDEIENLYFKIKKYFKIKLIEAKDKTEILEYINNSLFFALSLNPKLVKKLTYKLKKEILTSEETSNKFDTNEILEESIYLKLLKIAESNMFKNNMATYPLLSYLEFGKNKQERIENYKKINFFDTRYFDLAKSPEENELEKLKLCTEKMKLTPRFIHLDELNIFYIKRHILSYGKETTRQTYIEESVDKFKLNLNFKNKNKVIIENYIPQNFENENINFFKIPSKNTMEMGKIRIGIASLKINEKDLEKLNGKQELSIERKNIIIDILNLAKKNKVDILVFPELSIPFHWLKYINKFSRKNQILVTGGLEYLYCPELKYDIEHEKYVFNYLFTTLPFINENYESSFVKIRLKNHYSPKEIENIKGQKFSVPKTLKIEYDVFSWKGIHFANFNCFELSDIENRSRMKNYIDLLIASVFNKDISYFKNILESSCRDLHVYVAQSNTSKYGDCEIIQPKKKDEMIITNIKGGINHNLLVGEIDIESLREFQLLDYGSQEGKGFKLTPPGIDPNMVKARINNKIEIIMKKEKKYCNKENEIRSSEREKIKKLLIDSGEDEKYIEELFSK